MPTERPATDRALILVVDDETGPRESLKIILNPTYRVVAAQSGAEALDLFEQETPDLVISDIRMPGMTGTQLLAEIKRRSAATPVILITGYATVQTAQEAVRASAFDYISKPYNVTDILRVVAEAIKESQAERESQRAVRQLQQWNRQLEEQIGQLDQKASVAELSAEIIHDLNNPMSVIRGYIALLEDSLEARALGAMSDEQLEFLNIIKEQVNRCVRMTRSFLSFAGSPEGTWEKCNVAELVQDTLFVLRVRIMAQGNELKTQLDPTIPSLWLMRTPMQRLCYNLISNAIDANAATGRGASLTVSAQLVPNGGGEGQLQIEVTDCGPGIPQGILDRIFTPFFTTKPKDKGTGLGLAICKRVVDMHGGTLEVDTQPGRGTTFRVLVPARCEKPEEAPQPA
jgi:signal transduction histidine kinase